MDQNKQENTSTEQHDNVEAGIVEEKLTIEVPTEIQAGLFATRSCEK